MNFRAVLILWKSKQSCRQPSVCSRRDGVQSDVKTSTWKLNLQTRLWGQEAEAVDQWTSSYSKLFRSQETNGNFIRLFLRLEYSICKRVIAVEIEKEVAFREYVPFQLQNQKVTNLLIVKVSLFICWSLKGKVKIAFDMKKK